MTQKQAGKLLITGIVLLFPLIALIRLYPFENTLPQLLADTGNDWGRYATYALDIKHNGIWMPGIEGVYEKPASFFYSYFLAACFTLFGENTIPVFILQNMMLGLSILFIWLSFRDRIDKITGYTLLIALTVFGLTDVAYLYSSRFLGENLALFMLSLFFFFFIKATEKNNLPNLLYAALFLGISVLTRPNIFLYVGALIIFLGINTLRKREIKQSNIIVFATVLLLVSSFLALRNYMACQTFQLMPSQGFAYNMMAYNPLPPTINLEIAQNNFLHSKLHLNVYYAAYYEYMVHEPAAFFGHYVKKFLFCLGFLKKLVPSYYWFPHWTLMWLGYFTYLFLNFRNKAKTSLGEKSAHLFIFCYFSSVILVGQIENYGFRMLIPGNFFVLPFGVMGITKAFTLLKIKNNPAHS